MTDAELKDILEAHGKWFRGEAGGKRADLSGKDLRPHAAYLRSANLSNANLSNANLRGADLSSAYLRSANLSNANLSNADLSSAYLCGADLSNADLSGAYLSSAYLRSANLRSAYLRSADLSGADLSSAYLRRAHLSSAYLCGANLSNADLGGAYLSSAYLRSANLCGADLSNANLKEIAQRELVFAQVSIVPDTGAFVAWKKLSDGFVAKLQIPATAMRSSASGRKCRASHAKVLEIYTAKQQLTNESVRSIHDTKFVYQTGKTVRCHEWDDNRFNECGGGIHFYITRAEAEEYVP